MEGLVLGGAALAPSTLFPSSTPGRGAPHATPPGGSTHNPQLTSLGLGALENPERQAGQSS